MKMKIPPGQTEATVLAAIEKAVGRLAPAFSFGYFTPEDIRQEGYVLACEVLATEKFDPARPLDSFLFIHIRNRLSNLKRRVMRRNDPPCRKCAAGNHCRPDGPCKKYREWHDRNNAKSCLAGAGIESAAEDQGSVESPESQVELAEILEKIDSNLPIGMRADYLRMRAGEKLTNVRRSEIEEVLKEMLRDELCPRADD